MLTEGGGKCKSWGKKVCSCPIWPFMICGVQQCKPSKHLPVVSLKSPLRFEVELHTCVMSILVSSWKHDTEHNEATALTDV